MSKIKYIAIIVLVIIIVLLVYAQKNKQIKIKNSCIDRIERKLNEIDATVWNLVYEIDQMKG